jgi:hypothetical protein
VTAGRDDALARSRAAALAELRATPASVSWRAQAWRVVAGFAGTGLLGAAAALAASLSGWPRVLERAPLLLCLLATAALAGAAALAPPRGRLWRSAVLAAGPALMAALVLSRGPGTPSSTPEWVCSASHIGIGLIPLTFALWGLRQSAWRWSRALAAGLGAGTAGALLGELACHRGAQHVLVYHVGAWIIVAAACVVLSRRARPRSFAP